MFRQASVKLRERSSRRRGFIVVVPSAERALGGRRGTAANTPARQANPSA